MNNKKYRFIIVSPRQIWGGAIALHVLCKYLSEMGYDASVLYVNDMDYKYGHRAKFWIKHLLFTITDVYKKSKVKLFGEDRYIENSKYVGYVNETVHRCKQRIWPFANKNEIVIYPEKVYGNFMMASKVVRWFLYYNRYDEKAYGRNDMFVAFREVFNDKKLNPEGRILFVLYYNLQIYRQYNFKKREGNCYIVRKGGSRLDLPKHFDGPIVDDLPEKEKVKVFNESEYCICYDTQTSYSKLAALCGCISIVVPEEGKSRKDYRTNNDVSYGEAFGFSNEEIAYAKETRVKLKNWYKQKNEESKTNVDKFAKECKIYFG